MLFAKKYEFGSFKSGLMFKIMIVILFTNPK